MIVVVLVDSIVVVVVVVVLVTWEKPYDANRHSIPVRKEYFLLAITMY